MYPTHNSIETTTVEERSTIREQSMRDHNVSVWRPATRTRVVGKVA